MARISDLSERLLIALLASGELEIDAEGRVWRIASRRGLKTGGSHIVPEKRRRAERKTPDGYLQVRAVIDGKRLHTGAHRLVWQHFKGDIPPGHEINHRNGLKDDNRPGNLLCGTSGENVEHAHAGGLIDQYGQKNPAAKLTDNQVAQVRLAYSQGGHTQAQLAARFGISHQAVSKIVRGQRRPKQGGPTRDEDHRHAGDQDPKTGRFTGKPKAAGRLLDGRTHDGFPEGAHG